MLVFGCFCSSMCCWVLCSSSVIVLCLGRVLLGLGVGSLVVWFLCCVMYVFCSG